MKQRSASSALFRGFNKLIVIKIKGAETRGDLQIPNYPLLPQNYSGRKQKSTAKRRVVWCFFIHILIKIIKCACHIKYRFIHLRKKLWK